MEKEADSYAQITLKKSSSTGKVGFDIACKVTEATEDEMQDRMEIALKVCLKAERVLIDGGK